MPICQGSTLITAAFGTRAATLMPAIHFNDALDEGMLKRCYAKSLIVWCLPHSNLTLVVDWSIEDNAILNWGIRHELFNIS